jgi:hypothetical protein
MNSYDGDSNSFDDDDDNERDQYNDWLSDFANDGTNGDYDDDDSSQIGTTTDIQSNSKDSLDSDEQGEFEENEYNSSDIEALSKNCRKVDVNNLHLKYGFHVSSQYLQHESLLAEEPRGTVRFLPSFLHRKGVLLSESDAYKLVIEALLGFSNDIFELNDQPPGDGEHSGDSQQLLTQEFVLTYTARNVYLRGTSASSLQFMLEWFAVLATNMQICRAFSYNDSQSCLNILSAAPKSATSFKHNYLKNGETLAVFEAFWSSTIELIASVEAQLCNLDTLVSVAASSHKEHTLIALYASCRCWVSLFQSTSALVKTIMRPVPIYIPASTEKGNKQWTRLKQEREDEESFSGSLEEKGDRDIKRSNKSKKQGSTHVNYDIDGSRQQMWTALQCSGVMQGLFSLQRWRRITATRELNVAFSSTSVKRTGTASLAARNQTPSDASVVSSLCAEDACFSSHLYLYEGGLLSTPELNYFIGRLSSQYGGCLSNFFVGDILGLGIDSGKVYGSKLGVGLDEYNGGHDAIKRYNIARQKDSLPLDTDYFYDSSESNPTVAQLEFDYVEGRGGRHKSILMPTKAIDLREASAIAIADLMPLSTQLVITVSVPLRQALDSDLLAAVTLLRIRHGLVHHIKCEQIFL